MGQTLGSALCQSEEERRQHAESREIDRRLKEAYVVEKRTVKLLLLGTGECGKTTLIKQMRILHSNGFTHAELMQQRPIVYSNTMRAMEQMLKAMANLRIPFKGDPHGRRMDALVVMRALSEGTELQGFSAELANAMKRLWEDPGLNTTTYERRMEFHLHGSAKYFLDNLEKICKSDYCPTYDDMLHTHAKTTGIVEVDFLIDSVHLRVFDVGGQRSERKKWIHCFEGVHALIFLSAVSEFDQVLFEDETTNRLVESMRLFEAICNSRWFRNASTILFLNKKDLFEEKLAFVSIHACFREYGGPQSYEASIAYITAKFEKLFHNPEKTLYVHQTCATDTDQVQMILDSTISMIVKRNVQKHGLT